MLLVYRRVRRLCFSEQLTKTRYADDISAIAFLRYKYATARFLVGTCVTAGAVGDTNGGKQLLPQRELSSQIVDNSFRSGDVTCD